MNAQQKLDKAIERAEETLSHQLSYCTDDRGIPTAVFVWRAPGLKCYPTNISKKSVTSLAQELVDNFQSRL